KIGLDVASLDVTYSPGGIVDDNSPVKRAWRGIYDNWRVRVWRCIMPTPGDAHTFGCYPLFGGRIASTSVSGNQIKWTVNSWLDVINQQVPSNVIENTNTPAAYAGATPPYGFSFVPQFQVFEAVSDNIILADCIGPEDAGRIFDVNA